MAILGTINTPLKEKKEFQFPETDFRKEINKKPFAIEVYLPKGIKVILTEEQVKQLLEELQAENPHKRIEENLQEIEHKAYRIRVLKKKQV